MSSPLNEFLKRIVIVVLTVTSYNVFATNVENNWIETNTTTIEDVANLDSLPLLAEDQIQAVCYRDFDGDGYGRPTQSYNSPTTSCVAGFVTNNTDCNDLNNTINPGAAEICDDLDNNCNTSIDEGFASIFYYLDFDGDAFGDASVAIDGLQSCPVPTGFVLDNTDCNDGDAAINPGQAELCNGIDDDCDLVLDNGFTLTDFYWDFDGDGFGDLNQVVQACAAPVGASTLSTDCDDNDANNFPGNVEACDGFDNDCDGIADNNSDVDGDGFFVCTGDCDDNDFNVNPGATEVCNSIDDNCDGQIDEGFDGDNDGFAVCAGDCDDADATVNPGATEICNGVDENCNAQIDEGALLAFYFDNDNDGYGDPAIVDSACVALPGYVALGGDCDDAEALTNPGAAEVCDGIDNDCSGGIDEPFDVDGDNWSTCAGDCDDNDANVNPGVLEGPLVAGSCDFIDNNCDGVIDEFWDEDLDGFTQCQNDCNDFDDQVFPGQVEVCDAVDNNCDGTTDENPVDGILQFADVDGDTFGNPAVDTLACTILVGFVEDNSDCDDTNAAVNPIAVEVCDGLDNNCNTDIDEGATTVLFADTDGDTYGDPLNFIDGCDPTPGFVLDNTDCDDANAAVNPGATEICNLIDDNCDGNIDEGTLTTFYADADGDTYGDLNTTQDACTAPVGFVADNTDCDDANAAVNPGATEICNLIDDNCDGNIDEGTLTTFYADADGDTYGDLNTTQDACTAPVGFVADNTDCDDANAAVNPGATEICNLIDDNCDGNIDEGTLTTFYADADGDTFGDLNTTQDACTAPVGFVADNTDCDDANAAVNPGATEICNLIDDNCDGNIDEGTLTTFYADADGDTFGDLNTTQDACTAPVGFVADNTDCDDANAAVNPGATEICNLIDDNCDGNIDEGTLTTFYADADGDTYGDLNTTQDACTAPVGFVADNTDCDDANAAVNPGATEICNLIDDNCDGNIDEGTLTTFYADADGDTFGDLNTTQDACTAPVGFVADNTDCDDANAAVNPGATEICNLIDDNCDGNIDEGTLTTFYADADGDTFGDLNTTQDACTAPAGFVADNTDCDDANAAVNPGATEICNLIDDNCDGNIDEGTLTTFYADADGDTFGDLNTTQDACTAPAGFVADNTDCDDANAAVNPGATEICNLIDDNCDGNIDEGTLTTFYADADGDTFGDLNTIQDACTAPVGFVADNTDCDDANAAVNPGATEICNLIDDNCDGNIDEGTLTTFYADADGDTFGDLNTTQDACTAPVGFVADNTDCDDANAAVNPGATEICNLIDDNCDGNIDDGATLETFFADADGDGFGDMNVTQDACVQPAGFVTDNSDCDDTNAAVNPIAVELCDGLDNNCNTDIDEGVTTALFADTDGDTYGDPLNFIDGCDPTPGFVVDNTDCDDTNAAINPASGEVCNGFDDNCDGNIDEGVTSTLYADNDGDGFGDPNNSINACDPQSGYTIDNTDCDDMDALVNPLATDDCNGIDDNCDGQIDEDFDVDGDTWTVCNGDCDDNNALVNPGQVEICDQLDNDCNGGIDETFDQDFDGFTSCDGDCDDLNDQVGPGIVEVCNTIDDNCDGQIDEGLLITYFADVDGDGFGDALNTLDLCSDSVGYVLDDTDCDDNNAEVYPAALEICDGIDNNCDGTADEGLILETYFADADGDGFGDANIDSLSCEIPAGFVLDNTDCADSDASIFPGATELCNGLDDDCDTQIDNGVVGASVWYFDNDFDGFGLVGSDSTACLQPIGYVDNNTDCDDADALVNPGAIEECNAIDDNCDGAIDEGFDVDGDSWTVCNGDCDDNNPLMNPGLAEVCDFLDNDCNGGIDETFDQDFDGFTTCQNDCDDLNDLIFPGAIDICGNGIDEDCSGADSTCQGCTDPLACNFTTPIPGVDTCVYAVSYYLDADGDTYGLPGSDSLSCEIPTGYVTDNTDCDDTNNQVFPGATEICNQFDDNCDGQTDEGLAGTIVPSVSITASQTTICAGTSVTFTAIPVDGGSLPVYEWTINGVVVNSNVDTYVTDELFDGDTIQVTMTSNNPCQAIAISVSNEIGMSVGTVIASVDIIDNVATDTICAGSNVTFQASPTNGGSNPSYVWTLNGAQVSTTNTYIYPAPMNGDTLSVVMTSTASCLTSPTATDTSILIVSPLLTPIVTLAADDLTVCSGDLITFTATGTDTGSSPTYEWYVNGIEVLSSASSVWAVDTLSDGDDVYVRMIANNVCQAYSTNQSASLTVTISPNAAPTVSINTPSTTICVDASATFTATATDAGTNPVYTWYLNGIVVGNNSNTYTASSLTDGTQVWVEMFSNNSCAAAGLINSDTLTMVVLENIPDVVLSSNDADGEICQGSSVTFTATPTNGGTAPVYEWYLNSTVVTGVTTDTWTSTTLADGDVVEVMMLSNDVCLVNPDAMSNALTFVVSPSVTPSISAAASVSAICAGETVTFTSTPVNGGSTPTYSWEINGVAIGVNTPNYTTDSLNVGDAVTVVMTGSASCQTAITAESAPVFVTVTSNTPSVALSNNLVNDQLCGAPGAVVVYTATPTNGGTTPTYQWLVNDVVVAGQTGSSFTYTTPADNDVVTVVMTSNATCLTMPSDSTDSNPIDLIAPATPAVTIVSDVTTICPNGTVNFTSTVTDGGSAPTYQWSVNSNPVAGATASTFSPSNLVNGDVVTVAVVSNATCIVSSNATSNSITINVSTGVTPTVVIVSNDADNVICAGQSVTFTATPTDGGTTPLYQWFVGGVAVGANGTINTLTTTTLLNNQTVSVTMTANNACQATPTANSNIITTAVNPSVTPSVTIASNDADNSICAGISVTFTATPTNGGTAPTYQWQLNGSNVGTGGTTYTNAALANGDVVSLIITANNTCQTSPTVTSNSITTTVNPIVTPSLVIASDDADNTICAGQSVTFTATPTNGGTTPTYQWLLNGGNVGTGSATLTTTTLANGDVISVVMTANNACQTTATASSNTIAHIVTPSVTPAVTIASSDADNTICSGESVTFTAASVNGGTTPTYQWQVNGGNVGTGGTTFTSTTLNNGDLVTVIMTANNACQTAPTATSNAIATVVNTGVTPSVVIASSDADNTICTGDAVTFTATPTNGGTSPTYQWQLNGGNVGTGGNTFASSTLNNGDVVTVVMTANNTCQTTPTATSNAMTTIVNGFVTPAVTIASSDADNIVCSTDIITFTATPTNGGTAPTYQWLLNGGNVGTGGASFSTTVNNGDVISVIMTANNACQTAATATSNSITHTVTPSVTPSVTIASSDADNTICAGESVTFTATAVNAGPSPVYQWLVNSGNAGSGGTTFTTPLLNNGDVVTVLVIANNACQTAPTATTPGITMTVNPLLTPAVTVTSSDADNSICVGDAVTFTATPVNGGSAPTYQWLLNGGNVGTGGTTYTNPALNNNDVVSVVMTANNTCQSSATATSNAVTTVVNNFVTPSVTIVSSDADNNVCSTDLVTFTATPVNGGPSPTYQWQLNGGNVGAGSATFITTLNNGDVISVVMTANNQCQTTATATSNNITHTVTTSVTPSVTIASSDADNTICAGESVTFTATAVDGGPAPTYQWLVNSGNAGSGGTTFTTPLLNNGDVVTLLLIANNTCQTVPNAVSNAITMTVNPVLTPAVTVSSSDADNSICTGDLVTFTATPVNGGTAPTYQWLLNGGNVGIGGNTFASSTLNSGDVVSVIMTANNTCQTTATATSNNITTTVVAPVTPAVSIVSSDADNNICAGESVTFTATPVNGGSAPSFQWLLNGGNVGTGGTTFTTTTLTNGDVISVVMTANNACQTATTATSNTIATVVNALLTPTVTVSSTEPDNAFCAGTAVTYTANITDGGTTPAYQWFVNGVAVAGETNANFTTSSLINSDTISVSLLSNANCLASTLPVLSADVVVQVDAIINPSASILINGTSATDICEGSTNTISLDVVDAGPTVAYQWLLNGTDLGISSNTFDWPTLADGDQIGLIVTTSNACQNIVLDTVFAVINALPIQSSSISIVGPTLLCELNADADTLQMTPLFVQGVNYFGSTYEAYWIVDGVVTTQVATPGEILSLNDLGATTSVQLVLIDNYLCPATDSSFSTIINVGDAVLYYLDADGDGFGNPLIDTLTCENIPGYVLDNTDCSDNNPNTIACDGDGDGYTADVDCDDTNPAVNPAATEICENGIDDNCDGVQGNIYYWDADADGFATSDSVYISLDCEAEIIGFIDADSVTVFDCNNFDNTVYPGAPEICDGLDNDCNTFIDDGAGVVWYYDNDLDGFGSPDSIYILCFQPGPGWVTNSVDCNDNDPLVNPALDLDGDGFFSCINDCDDQNPAVNPAAAEVCNTIDDNCNNLVDEGLGTWFFADADADGYGNSQDSTLLCSVVFGYTENDSIFDCNDVDFAINPGVNEICANEVDENCDGIIEINCIPDAFSPNGDGISETFEYVADDRSSVIKMEVYNRWGSLVFVTEAQGRVEWDGIPNKGNNDSELLPVGTYYVVFTENGQTRTQSITLWY